MRPRPRDCGGLACGGAQVVCLDVKGAEAAARVPALSGRRLPRQ